MNLFLTEYQLIPAKNRPKKPILIKAIMEIAIKKIASMRSFNSLKLLTMIIELMIQR